MSRRRHHGNRPGAQPAAAPQKSAFESLREFKAFSPFDASRYSDRRTYVQRFSRDSAQELTGGDLHTVRNKSRYFYDNGGLPAAIIDGIANLIGFLMPQPRSADPAWNKAAKALFLGNACNPFIFDRAGKYDFRQWQIQNNICRFKDGDMLSVLTETNAGIASIITYEAHQIDNGTNSGTTPPDNLQDGVWKDTFGRHTGYRLVDPADQTREGYVKASDAIYFARFRSPGQVRGFPILSSVLNHLHDRQDIWVNTKTGIKAASEVLMYEKKDPNVRQPMSALALQELASMGTAVVDTTGTAKPITATFESQRLTGSIPDMAPGSTIELLHDDRPGPSQREFDDALVRDICLGTGWDPEVVHNLIKQNGPGVRFLMAKLKRSITQEHNRLRLICQRFYVYFIAKAIKAGFLTATDAWWECDWIPQADLTIDIGREGKLALDQLRCGATTHEQIWHDAGGDADTAFDTHLAFLTRCKASAESAGFQLSEVMPGFYQGLPAQVLVPDVSGDPSALPSQ